MTIESNLESIADALDKIAAMLQENKQLPLPLPLPTATVPEAAPAPIPTPAAAPAPIPTPAAVPAAAPTFAGTFGTQKELLDFTMAAYKVLGPIKGAMIQGILTELGSANIHSLPPEKYAEFKAKVDAL